MQCIIKRSLRIQAPIIARENFPKSSLTCPVVREVLIPLHYFRTLKSRTFYSLINEKTVVVLEGDDPGGGAFGLFLRPHPGAFRQLMCPHPGEFAHFSF